MTAPRQNSRPTTAAARARHALRRRGDRAGSRAAPRSSPERSRGRRPPPLLDPGDELLGEQRVALGELDDAVALASSTESPARLATSARCRRRRAGRASGSRLRPRGRPTSAVRRAGPGVRAREKHRCVVRPRSEVLDEVEEGRLGPVDSSKITTSGRSRARVSNERRTAQAVSPAVAGVSLPLTSAAMRSKTSSSSACSSSGSTSRSASTSGRYVAPSPYGTQRPTSTRASSSDSTNSRAIRVLPIPAFPTSAMRRQRRSVRATSSARRSAPISSCRPTNGESNARATPGASAWTLRRRYASSGSALPRRTTGPSGSTSTASRTSRSVASPRTASPGSASSWSACRCSPPNP